MSGMIGVVSGVVWYEITGHGRRYRQDTSPHRPERATSELFAGALARCGGVATRASRRCCERAAETCAFEEKRGRLRSHSVAGGSVDAVDMVARLYEAQLLSFSPEATCAQQRRAQQEEVRAADREVRMSRGAHGAQRFNMSICVNFSQR